MKKLNVLIMLIMTMQISAKLAAEPSNYNSGISLFFSGTQGVEWDEEVFWHNPVEDDHKVVYIKEDTLITMQHNERNMCRNTELRDFDYNAGDNGTIRYRVDRDLQLGYYWAVMTNLYPEYTGPLTFRDLRYGTPDNTPVLGTTGGVGSDPNDRTGYYHAGQIDKFGDEWHTIAFADDDSWLAGVVPDINMDSHGVRENLASDGKTILFVVNPKTPLIKFSKQSQNAQFYTTPAKNYWIPKIHEQITYVTDDVNISLVNIMGGDIYYRINDGDIQQYAGPISVNSLIDGDNIIEYWYDDNFHKTRKIVKNPDFPSGNEEHGYLMWKDDTELDQIKGRLERGEDHGYKDWFDSLKRDNYFNHHNIVLGEGRRVGGDVALTNAFIALVEGYTYTRQGDSLSYAEYAKWMLLDNKRVIDPLWFGDPSGTPNPCRQVDYRGYYDVNKIYSAIFAYDILIKDYKSTQYSEGITPIEDYKIRDMLARFVLECTMELGNYGHYYNSNNTQGMWGTARCLAGLVVAVGMPTYDTHYYGTSGFDGKSASHPYTPFPDHPITWKQAFFTEDTTLYGYPNQAHQYDDNLVYTQTGAYYVKCILEQDYDRGDRIISAGNFADRKGYITNALMGHCYYIAANIMKIKMDHTYEYWEMLFDNANKGTLYGLKISSGDDGSDLLPGKYPQLFIINERFPELAREAEDNLHLDYDNPDNAFTLWRQMTSNGVYGLILYHDDWESYVDWDTVGRKPDDFVVPSDIPDATGLWCYNNVFNPKKGEKTTLIIRIKEASFVSVIIYDSKGIKVKTVFNEQLDSETYARSWDGSDDTGKEVGSGIYMVHMQAGAYKETKKIAVIK